MPSDQDILHARVKTTGVNEVKFVLDSLTYRVVDVGGQRSERKKWIQCFEGVDTILFLVAISEYDQLLFENQAVNRMDEALTLFDSICNSPWFLKTSIILFLNKTDIFKEKLHTSPLSKQFPEYQGKPHDFQIARPCLLIRADGSDFSEACDYLLNRFISLNRRKNKQIYTHFTCATDTTQISFVLDAVKGMLLP